jgi:ElaB/YqjD/DUF883 family membrane-anchored ribosome-binding protein
MDDKVFQDKAIAGMEFVVNDSFISLKREDLSTEKIKEHLPIWAEDRGAQFLRKLDDFKSLAQSKAEDAAKSIEQDMDQGLHQYNVKVQDLADQVPGDFSRQAAKYPWVTLSVVLVVGILLGSLLKLPRQFLGKR